MLTSMIVGFVGYHLLNKARKTQSNETIENDTIPGQTETQKADTINDTQTQINDGCGCGC